MRILEVASDPKPDRLVALVTFLTGRAQDTGARKQISKQAFMSMAQQLGINSTPNFLVNGRLLRGALSLSVFEDLLNQTAP